MPQDRPRSVERRSEPRRPAAFAFWFEPEPDRQRSSAWMVDVASGGASFLASATEAPVVGQRLALAEMFSRDPFVRDRNTPLPAHARVVRVDDVEGPIRHIAVRFEADQSAPLATRSERHAATARSESSVAARFAPAFMPHHGAPEMAVPVQTAL